MGKQENIFLQGEGDAWFKRNFWKVQDQIAEDPVCAEIRARGLSGPNSIVMEFGCSDGWRLNQLIDDGFANIGCGVDPSQEAIENGQKRFNPSQIKLARGTMTAHPFSGARMNLVIYGFCLYVCDPEELCEIVTQGDHLLADGGHLIIHDFNADFPHAVPNKHVEGLMTHKMDWGKLWLANPAYKLVAKRVMPDETAIWVLKKDQKGAFPCFSVSSA